MNSVQWTKANQQSIEIMEREGQIPNVETTLTLMLNHALLN